MLHMATYSTNSRTHFKAGMAQASKKETLIQFFRYRSAVNKLSKREERGQIDAIRHVNLGRKPHMTAASGKRTTPSAVIPLLPTSAGLKWLTVMVIVSPSFLFSFY